MFETASSTPGDLSIYVGRSAKTKLFDFFSEALASTGNHETTVAGYEDRSSSLESKLTKIDQRESTASSHVHQKVLRNGKSC